VPALADAALQYLRPQSDGRDRTVGALPLKQ
jgi:hypothetical protein